MLALCRLRVPTRTFLSRANATLQSKTEDAPPPPAVTPKPKLNLTPAPAPKKAAPATTAQTAAAPTEPEADTSKTTGRRRRRPIPPKRPKISLKAPRKWNRPIGEGVIPAYDLALKLIRKDAFRLTHEAEAVSEEVKALEERLKELGGLESTSEEATEVLDRIEERRKKLKILEVQSKVNLPDLRWKVNNAMADMTDPAHRHLVEQKWRDDGDLDLSMERLHQMHVFPDVLPDMRPTVDVHVVSMTTPREHLELKQRRRTVEPGSYLIPGQTVKPPHVYVNAFHTDTRLYTMILVDPDVPDEENQSFRTYLHWLKPNVPLSATTRAYLNLDDHTPYIPPHPQQGTPYHRYVLLLLPQPPLSPTALTHPLTNEAFGARDPSTPTSQVLDIPVVGEEERRRFDVRAFVKMWGLDVVPGGGAHMWREEWSPRVSKIYKNVLNEPEPRFGRPPKADRYLDYKLNKRYI